MEEHQSTRPRVLQGFEQYDENGVDLSLIRFMLSLSPLERLKWMERNARDTQILNEYGRKHWEARNRSDR